MRRIAVVGAGIFGTVAAIELARTGYEVQVFEAASDLLQGTTAANTGRLHLGFHYPRDEETAQQSRTGVASFQEQFPNVTFDKFDNFYGLVEEGGKTSLQEYESFLRRLGEHYEPVREPPMLVRHGLDFARVSGVWRTEEGVIKVAQLRREISRRLKDFQIPVHFERNVDKLVRTRQAWILHTGDDSLQFDAVILATYGQTVPHSELGPCGCRDDIIEQATLVLEIEAKYDPFGLTLMDGDFLTVLPSETNHRFYVYGPGPGVIEERSGRAEVRQNHSLRADLLAKKREETENRLNDWLPRFSGTVLQELVGRRVLLKGLQSTDGRPSKIRRHGPGLLEIWSGKLDHSVDLAVSVRREIGLEFRDLA